ncbi:MAG: hypothetical protein GEU71_14670 [Actinobacteria bacterium]|nr:hypothetical protein [Actinomycetota bacterium]
MSDYAIGATYRRVSTYLDCDGVFSETWAYVPHIVLPNGFRYPFFEIARKSYRKALRKADERREAWEERDRKSYAVLNVNDLDLTDLPLEDSPPSYTTWSRQVEEDMERDLLR